MPPWILAALAAVAVALPTAIVIISVVRGPLTDFLNANLRKQDADNLRNGVDTVYGIVAGLAKLTPTTLDDDVAKCIGLLDESFKNLHGRPLTDGERAAATTLIIAKHLDPAHPDLGKGDPADHV